MSVERTRGSRRRCGGRGFSLLELMVALSVLAVSLLGLAQLLGVAIQQNQLARYNTAAMEVARGKLERLKAAYSRQLETGIPAEDLTDGSHGPETVVLSSQRESYGSRTLALRWEVSTVAGSRKRLLIEVVPLGAGEGQGLWHKRVTIETSLSP